MLLSAGWFGEQIQPHGKMQQLQLTHVSELNVSCERRWLVYLKTLIHEHKNASPIIPNIIRSSAQLTSSERFAY